MTVARKEDVGVHLDLTADETVRNVGGDSTSGTPTTDIPDQPPSRYMGCRVSNVDNDTYFLQLFNALAIDVTIGTTTPFDVVPIARGDATDFGILFDEPPGREVMSNGMSYAVTTTATGLTGPTTPMVLSIFYKS